MNNSDRTLRSAAATQNMVIGTAVKTRRLREDKQYRDTVAKQFNSITAEYEMKFKYMQPEQGKFDFSKSDELMNFAKQNKMNLRGHTLVWHLDIPTWIEKGNWSRKELLNILETHIKTVVGRYRGQIKEWDVVNEAVGDDGKLRNSFWLQKIGPEYIDLAFKWAREADPDAKLLYNDYRIEEVNNKSNRVFKLVSDLKSKGIPIDGVGFQMHMSEDDPRKFGSVKDNMKRLGNLGMEVQFTEADVRIKQPFTDQKLNNQAKLYETIVETCLEAGNCESVTIWGVTDRYSWIPSFFKGYGEALPFDENYKPKPAFSGILDGFLSTPPTKQPPVTPPPTPPTTPPEPDVAPTITTPAAVTVAENQTAVLNIESTDDVDSEGNGLTYRLTGGADANLFSINNSGVLQFKAEPDFEKPGDANRDNIYKVNIAATDSDKLTTTQNLSITVSDVVETPVTPPVTTPPTTPPVTTPPVTTPPIDNNQPATIYVNDNNKVVGNAYQAGQRYSGKLSSRTDNSNNSDDIITGTNANDKIWAGRKGSDRIDAGNGNDKIGFGDGNSYVDAGSGNDLVYAAGRGAGQNTIDLGSGYDQFWAPAGNNTITGTGNNKIGIGTGNDSVNTGNGQDTVYGVKGGGGNNTLNLGGGRNTVRVNNGNYTVTTGSGNDFIQLGTGEDSVKAGNGNNKIYVARAHGMKQGSKDILTGTGNDRVYSGTGNDRLDLGTGYDVVAGRGGRDTFVLNQGNGFVNINDFQQGIDKLELGSLSLGDLQQSTKNGQTWLSKGNDTLAKLANFTGNITTEDVMTTV